MEPTRETILLVWGVSLALLLVVAVVVAVLLELVRRTAGDIHGGAAAIWTQGKLVANNTIQIPMLLGRVLRQVERIGAEVAVIGGATTAIRTHAESCPGCPHCALGGKE